MTKMDINSLRTILAEEINKLRDGSTTPANVNAITNATGKILSTVKLEMEYHKLLGKTPNIDFIKVSDKKILQSGKQKA
jgi:hypothetical protein